MCEANLTHHCGTVPCAADASISAAATRAKPNAFNYLHQASAFADMISFRICIHHIHLASVNIQGPRRESKSKIAAGASSVGLASSLCGDGTIFLLLLKVERKMRLTKSNPSLLIDEQMTAATAEFPVRFQFDPPIFCS